MSSEAKPILMAEILSALSYALDLTEGQPMGHSVRTCLIAMRIGKNLGLDETELRDLYFASLLKDAGCSNNSARIQKIFGGDELITKRNVKLIDWTSNLESLKFAFANTERESGFGTKLKTMLKAIGPPTAVMDGVTKARCTRGAQIALQLGFGKPVADAIYALDEHWDGRGSPEHRHGESIPLLSRILCLAQTLEVLYQAFGLGEALEIVKKRTGAWFDPQITFAAIGLETDSMFWLEIGDMARTQALQIETPANLEYASDSDIDQICTAFASIIDAKSTFTGEHSSRVTLYALELAKALGFDPERITILKRASLLHDIGKLGVSNSILEKPGPLDDEEFVQVKKHPYFTQEILKQIQGFERITEVAAAHHERLDGRGYFQGLDASRLDLDMRIVSAADVFDALSAKRPYREAMPMSKVFEIMEKDAGNSLDAQCVGTLKDLYYAELSMAA
ncbi:MAG: HD domain-containing protein [Chlorobia bacterium]|nr:HD domain-containing protein [Fimbriimonadaceae bacterium]